MRNLAGIMLLFLLVSSATAQDFPRAEVFGGYQYSRQQSTNLNGWNASLTGNYNRWFGLTGDFSGAYHSEGGADFRSYTYTFGPTVAARNNEKFTPFAHALFGGVHQSTDFAGSSLGSVNGFAVFLGGGVDATLSPHLAVRVGQFDYARFHFSAGSANVFRYSAGIVFRP
jgi:hypothetical protein